MKPCTCTAISLPPKDGVCLICGGEPRGATGATGVPALVGSFGPTPPRGANGPTGPTGTPYFVWR